MRERVLWEVSLPEHEVGGRYRVPATRKRSGGSTASIAIASVVRWAHIDAGVPPFRAFLSESRQVATAGRVPSELTVLEATLKRDRRDSF